MSKSKGNVYYPEDLVAKGYGNDHVRFFLIYWPYRKRLNFTFKKLAETSQRLDVFRGMVQNLRWAKSINPSEKAGALAGSLVSSFEENMNNDLDVKAAFDELYETVYKLDGLMKEARLSAEDANAAINGLHRIDNVLRIVF